MFGMGSDLYEYSDEEQDLGKVYDRVLMKTPSGVPQTLQIPAAHHRISYGGKYAVAIGGPVPDAACD